MGGFGALDTCSCTNMSTVLSYGQGTSARDMSRGSFNLCDRAEILRGQAAPGERRSNVILRVALALACSPLSHTCSSPRF